MSDKEQEAIKRLQLAAKMSERYYKKPLLICYSGGKDSEVILELAKRAEIPFEVQHSHTTADAPETVYHVRDTFERLENEGIKAEIIKPTYQGKRISMWSLIPLKLIPPTRAVRYCCAVLKETAGANRAIVTGVRGGESVKRKTRKYAEIYTSKAKDKVSLDFEKAAELFDNPNGRTFIEHDEKFLSHCKVQGKTVFNPIIDWSDHDVWDYIESECLNLNPFYKKYGMVRCGCIGCPMGNKQRYKQFAIFPKFKNMYMMAFHNMLLALKAKGKPTKWHDAQEVFDWWMKSDTIPGQITIDDWVKEHENHEDNA